MACFVTGGAFMLAVAAWHLRRRNQPEVFRPALRLAGWVVLVAGLGVVVTGDLQARVMTEQQPMKMAAAEALYTTTEGASFSLFTVGSLDGTEEIFSIRVPKLLSLMATTSLDGRVDGVDNLQSAYAAQFGPGDYRPYIPITYWSFRLMIGFGVLAMLIAALTLWHARRGRTRLSRWVWPAATWAIALPLLANSTGWIFTEVGRQPWTVFGVLTTADSVSPGVSAGDVALSLGLFTALYGILAVIELLLVLRYARGGAPDEVETAAQDDADRPLSFAY
jgi:cytochrome d ubiquinol oxidase subunit I